jgi:hypothetical protein
MSPQANLLAYIDVIQGLRPLHFLWCRSCFDEEGEIKCSGDVFDLPRLRIQAYESSRHR